ncbi:WD40/YVTN repeat-like-containing domain-containing protein [Artemisia annua]|uniref:WD40/YVTN repeat-like-containing domain-containing protein n=1 Tax=Artemisia annua TaxID=35608 RepID=A0A2U1LPY1_ARTAN|nr:WD40/YVTN repeat-like-containing domain-containing protein [Artemisia annua]
MATYVAGYINDLFGFFVSSSDIVQPGWLLAYLRSINSTQIQEMQDHLAKIVVFRILAVKISLVEFIIRISLRDVEMRPLNEERVVQVVGDFIGELFVFTKWSLIYDTRKGSCESHVLGLQSFMWNRFRRIARSEVKKDVIRKREIKDLFTTCSFIVRSPPKVQAFTNLLIKVEVETTGGRHIGRGRGRYSLSRTSIKNSVGSWKEYKGWVVDVSGTTVRIKLGSQMKVVTVADTSSAQARKGKDIQGIPWDRLNITRESYRRTKLNNTDFYWLMKFEIRALHPKTISTIETFMLQMAT